MLGVGVRVRVWSVPLDSRNGRGDGAPPRAPTRCSAARRNRVDSSAALRLHTARLFGPASYSHAQVTESYFVHCRILSLDQRR